jgi:transposase
MEKQSFPAELKRWLAKEDKSGVRPVRFEPTTLGSVVEDFFVDLQDEIDRELRLMEAEEAESKALDQRIEELCRKLHPSDNLHAIPGVEEHTAPVFVATIGDARRFPGQSAFANWTGVVPTAKQSFDVESKGRRMTKAGPAIMKWALYQTAQIGRQWEGHTAGRSLFSPDGSSR